jgi:hypothetical protein
MKLGEDGGDGISLHKQLILITQSGKSLALPQRFLLISSSPIFKVKTSIHIHSQ